MKQLDSESEFGLDRAPGCQFSDARAAGRHDWVQIPGPPQPYRSSRAPWPPFDYSELPPGRAAATVTGRDCTDSNISRSLRHIKPCTAAATAAAAVTVTVTVALDFPLWPGACRRASDSDSDLTSGYYYGGSAQQYRSAGRAKEPALALIPDDVGSLP